MNEEDRENVIQMQEVTGMASTASAARVIYVLRMMDQDVVQVLGGLVPRLLQSMVASDPRLRDTGGISIQSIIASLGLGSAPEGPLQGDIETLEVSFDDNGDVHDDRLVSMYEDPGVDCLEVNDGPMREPDVYADGMEQGDVMFDDGMDPRYSDAPYIEDDVNMMDPDRYPPDSFQNEPNERYHSRDSRDLSQGRDDYRDDDYRFDDRGRRSASHNSRDRHRESHDQEYRQSNYRGSRERDWRSSERGSHRSEDFRGGPDRREDYNQNNAANFGPNDRDFRRDEQYEYDRRPRGYDHGNSYQGR